LITGQTGGEDFIGMMVTVMAVLLIINNIFQGCGSGPCQRIIVHWVEPKRLSTMTSIWNTSHSIGAGIVSVICGYIIGTYGQWQLCFWIPAIIAAAGVFFMIVTLRDTPTSVGLPEIKETKTELDDNDSPEAFKAFPKKMVFKNPIIWTVATISFFVYIVRFAVLDWGPTFLMERSNPLSPEMAGWTIAIFEMAGCAGMILSGWISDKVFKGKAQRVCLIEMVIVAVLLAILHFLPETASPILLLILLALTGFFLYGPQTLVGVVAFKQATKKASATAIGLIGLMSYGSVLITGVGLGWYSDHFGWDTLFLLMAGVSVLGTILSAFLWNIKDDAYIHES
jgi:OPA family glycerol-3-phosphate transporter-like MFS transporter/OPA family sugar phosphate sensor protein UhpC-like MFS transporter